MLFPFEQALLLPVYVTDTRPSPLLFKLIDAVHVAEACGAMHNVARKSNAPLLHNGNVRQILLWFLTTAPDGRGTMSRGVL